MFLHGAVVVYNGYYGRGYAFGVNYQIAVEAPQRRANWIPNAQPDNAIRRLYLIM